MAYAEVQIPKRPTLHRRRELKAQCARLLNFAKDDPLTVVNGAWCRTFTKQSSTRSMARHDLEIARAAVNHYDKEYGLAYKPVFTLPEKGNARSDHLTRDMAARLLLAAWRLKEVQRDKVTTRQVGQHIARFILIGLYTGTRSGAILKMQWMPNTTGGWFDLDKGVMYRKPDDEAETKKRKRPAVIPDRLLVHLKRWKRLDSAHGAVAGHVIRFNGNPVKNISKGWRSSRTKADLPKWVVPHILRHTAITWSMQAGKNVNLVSSYYNVSVKVLEDVYWHHHPDYQREMRRTK